ncbi:776c25ce-7d79-451c-a8d7-7b9d623eeebd-CDS [Sclerotinia trifoliorum]|uniref:776c25ce-7d79-451c-a8d7-7b9d623eeebd-CDS n=1 Tax=Sclerotinia trifoliorum TaxID=28548 RepID=A0A8H2W064_9HELO|nr:776c25ce-7d79-451c-a8d7-7b9d623eeebd-CDS [Sclerotinia trifoliorum]
MFFKKARKAKKATSMIPTRLSVLIPLYIYPSPGAWERLFQSITSYPSIRFIVVVNPHNGPGRLLDSNYKRDICKLNQYPNVVVVGYVSTAYATRQYSSVLEDVMVYAGWRLEDDGLGVRGIFFDETPNQWTTSNASFLGNINTAVKGSSGLGAEPLVIHNPGTIPHSRLMSGTCLPDINVVFEATYETYHESGFEKALTDLNVDRGRLACVMHSVPHSLMTTYSDVASEIEKLKPFIGVLFVTSQATDLYTSLGDHWEQFIQAISL